MRSQAVVAAVVGVFTDPLITRRCRWSLSDRPQSFMTFDGSVGALKNASPTSFIDFDSV